MASFSKETNNVQMKWIVQRNKKMNVFLKTNEKTKDLNLFKQTF